LLLAAGCGSSRAPSSAPPKIPSVVANRLATESDGVAAALARGDSCSAATLAAQLRSDASASIGRIPARYQEQLSSGVNAVVAAVPTCIPPPAPDAKHGHGDGQGNNGQGD
jgi:hypothetical protein